VFAYLAGVFVRPEFQGRSIIAQTSALPMLGCDAIPQPDEIMARYALARSG